MPISHRSTAERQIDCSPVMVPSHSVYDGLFLMTINNDELCLMREKENDCIDEWCRLLR